MSDSRESELPELTISPDLFLSGALVTDKNRTIIYANSYFEDQLNWPLSDLVGMSSDDLFTRSSKIFNESYLMPILIHEGSCKEIQLAVLDGTGARVPIVVNARVDDSGLVYWSFFNATKRDKLYDELLAAREKLELYSEELKAISSTDELTGLFNRRELNARASQMYLAANRTNSVLSCLLIDVDFFKKVNDVHGHKEGDRVLKELGAVLKKVARQTDLAARFGGEEFVLLLPDTPTPDALILCERLQHEITLILVSDRSITVSIGVSDSKMAKGTDELFVQADKALYEAKNQGRNRTIIYHPALK